MPAGFQPVAESVVAYNTMVAPADGATIVSIAAASLPGGLYHVRVATGYGATIGALDGMALFKGDMLFANLLVPNWAFQENTMQHEAILRLDGSTAISVRAAGAGPAGSLYIASMIATRIMGV